MTHDEIVRYNRFLLLVAGLGGLLYGIDVGIIAGALLRLWGVPRGGASPSAISEPPAWAYPVPPPDVKSAPDDGAIRTVPGSSVSYTTAQLNDLFLAPDWHPLDHPKMPEVVAHGRKPDVIACGHCHRAEGPGGPENASLAGLP